MRRDDLLAKAVGDVDHPQALPLALQRKAGDRSQAQVVNGRGLPEAIIPLRIVGEENLAALGHLAGDGLRVLELGAISLLAIDVAGDADVVGVAIEEGDEESAPPPVAGDSPGNAVVFCGSDPALRTEELSDITGSIQ